MQRDDSLLLDMLTRIIHEDFYYNRRYAATTSLTAGRLRRSVGQHTVQVCFPPSRLRAPVSHGVLGGFVTNSRE